MIKSVSTKPKLGENDNFSWLNGGFKGGSGGGALTFDIEETHTQRTIHYSQSVKDYYKRIDIYRADRDAFDKVKDRWGTAGDFAGVSGTMLKVSEIASRYESRVYSTKFGFNKIDGKIPGIKSAEIMSRYGKISAVRAASSLKVLGNTFGVIGAIATVGESYADGKLTLGDGAKVAFSVVTMLPGGWILGVADLSLKWSTGKGIADRIAETIDN